MEGKAVQIRSDLSDIENTVRHLYELSHYYWDNKVELAKLCHPDGRPYNSLETIHKLSDKEFIKAVEDVCEAAGNTAHSLGIELQDINSVRLFPEIKEFIKKIRSYQEQWIAEDTEILDRCEKLVDEQKYCAEIDYVAIRQIIDLHRKQLKILRSLDADLKAVENSERYKLEESLSNENISDASVTDDLENSDNIFCLEGDFWSIKFNGVELPPIEKLKGMAYISELLSQPRKEISASELKQIIDKRNKPQEQISQQRVCDRQAIEEIKEEIKRLKLELEEAKKNNDDAAEKRIQQDLDKMSDYLENNKGIGSQIRQFTDQVEKDRTSVTKAINRALEKIKEHNNNLYLHLTKSINTGADLSYQPERQIEWLT
jgi:hypothetical protein